MREIFLVLLTATLCVAQTTSNGWQLFWSDEFNGAANTPPDPANWNYDLGGGGWGNGEQETYTNSIANAFQDGLGNLVIRAIRDSSGNYTSARLRSGMTASTDTANLIWQFGKVEARIKLPFGAGVWPAFWMLGADINTVPWPGCGEIDILENFGANIDNPATVHGTIHGRTTRARESALPFSCRVRSRLPATIISFLLNGRRTALISSWTAQIMKASTPRRCPPVESGNSIIRSLSC